MAAFPVFIELEQKPCLVVGGGHVAYRKAKTLQSFGAKVTVVAKQILPEFAGIEGICLHTRPFCREDVNGMTIVFAATSDAACNQAVLEACRANQIPVNVADVPEACDFYFPALVRRGDVVVGIGTGGKSPALAKKLRMSIDSLLPDTLGEQTEAIGALRKQLLREGKAPANDADYLRLVDESVSFLKADGR